MSKTDKTRPSWVRLLEAGAVEGEPHPYIKRRLFDYVPPDFKWSNAERGSSPKHIRWAKRYRSKANRRRKVPHQAMRGYGYGWENYEFE